MDDERRSSHIAVRFELIGGDKSAIYNQIEPLCPAEFVARLFKPRGIGLSLRLAAWRSTENPERGATCLVGINAAKHTQTESRNLG